MVRVHLQLDCHILYFVIKGVVNQMLDREYDWLKCGYFDDKIWIGGEIPKGTPFYIYKATCDPKCDRQRARLTYLYQSELLSKPCYEYWVNYRKS